MTRRTTPPTVISSSATVELRESLSSFTPGRRNGSSGSAASAASAAPSRSVTAWPTLAAVRTRR